MTKVIPVEKLQPRRTSPPRRILSAGEYPFVYLTTLRVRHDYLRFILRVRLWEEEVVWGEVYLVPDLWSVRASMRLGSEDVLTDPIELGIVQTGNRGLGIPELQAALINRIKEWFATEYEARGNRLDPEPESAPEPEPEPDGNQA